MNRKIILFLISVVVTILSLCGCQQKTFLIKDESFYSDFRVEDGKVYIYCTLFVNNLTGREANVTINASFKYDVKNGLLKDTVIDGYSIDGKTKYFQLQKGENCFEVVFIGEHAGGNQKHDRSLPHIKISSLDT